MVTANYTAVYTAGGGGGRGGGGQVASPVMVQSDAGGLCEMEALAGWPAAAGVTVCDVAAGKSVPVAHGADAEGRRLWRFGTSAAGEYRVARGGSARC